MTSEEQIDPIDPELKAIMEDLKNIGKFAAEKERLWHERQAFVEKVFGKVYDEIFGKEYGTVPDKRINSR